MGSVRPDPSLFVPTDEMKARGPAVAMTSATKVTRVHGQGPLTSSMTLHAVCVFGMVTAAGHLTEAHALQPSDPDSQVAIEDALKIDFSPQTPPGRRPASICIRDRKIRRSAAIERRRAPHAVLDCDERRGGCRAVPLRRTKQK